jgi:FkbM family methyltransferase
VNHSEIEDCRKRVQIFQCAVSDQKGSATFNFVPQAAGLSGLKEQNYPEGAEIVSETVTVDTLDSLIADYEKIRFIKLDIEGAEFHALKGASKLLASAQPIFAMESGNAGAGERYGYSREDFFGLMESLGYDLFSALGSPFTQAGWGRPAPWYLFGVPRSDPHAYHRVVLPAIIRSLYEHLPGIHDKRA